jgi:hypothetical protein
LFKYYFFKKSWSILDEECSFTLSSRRCQNRIKHRRHLTRKMQVGENGAGTGEQSDSNVVLSMKGENEGKMLQKTF